MPRTTRLDIAASDIFRAFDEDVRHVFWLNDIHHVLDQNRVFWRLSRNMPATRFIEFLMTKGELRRIELKPLNHDIRTIERYIWRRASPVEVAFSTQKNAYLCHGTAVYLHGLNDQIPRRFYLNKEQSPKPSPAGKLTQASIDRAFAGKQRETSLVYRFENSEVAMIAGKHTDLSGTIEIDHAMTKLRVTSLERTLIDIAVRPFYAGGPFQVLAAYRGARDRISVGTLIATLRRLNYMYPFHQAIGFYMQQAGYAPFLYNRLKEMGLEFDFHLAYGVKNAEYVSDWRLHIPKGLQ